jgi:hypothetical protein
LSLALNRYYEPLRLPLRPEVISVYLIHHGWPSSWPPQRVSRTVLQFFRHMPSLLPREVHRTFPFSNPATAAFPI